MSAGGRSSAKRPPMAAKHTMARCRSMLRASPSESGRRACGTWGLWIVAGTRRARGVQRLAAFCVCHRAAACVGVCAGAGHSLRGLAGKDGARRAVRPRGGHRGLGRAGQHQEAARYHTAPRCVPDRPNINVRRGIRLPRAESSPRRPSLLLPSRR